LQKLKLRQQQTLGVLKPHFETHIKILENFQHFGTGGSGNGPLQQAQWPFERD